MRFILLTLLLCGSAVAAPIIERVHIVGRATADGPWTTGPTEARQGDDARLAVVLQVRDGRRRFSVADDNVRPLRLDRARVRDVRPWDALDAPVEVRWSRVEPHPWRPADPPPRYGAISPYYSNVATVPGRGFGRWLGYDRIIYYETPLGDWSSAPAAHQRPATAERPGHPFDRGDGLGTMRYAVEVRLPDGRTLRTPGAEAVDQKGMRNTVHRVTIRRDDTWLGYLTGYLNVPEVFGSAGGNDHQADRYVGVDCADVLTGALRARGHRVPYSHVAGLTQFARVVVPAFRCDDAGQPAEPITNAEVGDLIRINYGGLFAGITPRSWDHVGAFFADRSDPDGPHHGGPDGQLDGFDLVAHIGHPELTIAPLSTQCPATLDVLRWKPKAIGPPK